MKARVSGLLPICSITSSDDTICAYSKYNIICLLGAEYAEHVTYTMTCTYLRVVTLELACVALLYPYAVIYSSTSMHAKMRTPSLLNDSLHRPKITKTPWHHSSHVDLEHYKRYKTRSYFLRISLLSPLFLPPSLSSFSFASSAARSSFVGIRG